MNWQIFILHWLTRAHAHTHLMFVSIEIGTDRRWRSMLWELACLSTVMLATICCRQWRWNGSRWFFWSPTLSCLSFCLVNDTIGCCWRRHLLVFLMLIASPDSLQAWANWLMSCWRSVSPLWVASSEEDNSLMRTLKALAFSRQPYMTTVVTRKGS